MGGACYNSKIVVGGQSFVVVWWNRHTFHLGVVAHPASVRKRSYDNCFGDSMLQRKHTLFASWLEQLGNESRLLTGLQSLKHDASDAETWKQLYEFNKNVGAWKPHISKWVCWYNFPLRRFYPAWNHSFQDHWQRRGRDVVCMNATITAPTAPIRKHVWGFTEDEDADLADELLVGFEEGVSCLKVIWWLIAYK